MQVLSTLTVLAIPVAIAASTAGTAPNAPGGDNLVKALGRVIAETTFFKPLLVQCQYDGRLAPTYSVRAALVPGFGGKAVDSENWIMLVRLVANRAEVQFRNGRPTPPKTGFDHLSNRAVEVATKNLADAGRLSLPCVISISKQKSRWEVLFTRIPAVSGGFTFVEVANNFRHVRIEPGD